MGRNPIAFQRTALVGAAILGTLCLSTCSVDVPTTPPSTSVTSSAPSTSPETPPPETPPPDPTPPPEPTRTPTPPTFTSSVSTIILALAERMSASWRTGCPVPLTDLRLVTLTHRTFEGAASTGELVVHKDVARDVVGIFEALFEDDFPIRSMRLVDDFDADDNASMAADNTSAFNCRPVAGTSSWSEHSYGTAIDINPRENPWVSNGVVIPSKGSKYLDRPHSAGVIHARDLVVRAIASAGWKWGGNWTRGITDYQHFSVSGT